MRKTIEVVALGLSLCLGAWSMATHAEAQDPEEGAVDLNETSKPAAEPSSGAPAWEAPPGSARDEDEDDRPDEQPEEKAEGPGKLRIFAGARIGVGGGFQPKDTNVAYVAKMTPGFQLGAEYLLHKYFALGLETRFSWATVKSNDSNYMIWDLSLKPRALYRVKPVPVEIYLAVPGGLSLNKPGQSFEDGKVAGSVGIFGGASYFFNDSWALNAELGWTWTFLHFKTVVQQAAPPGTGLPPQLVPSDAKVKLGQLTLLALNVVYAF